MNNVNSNSFCFCSWGDLITSCNMAPFLFFFIDGLNGSIDRSVHHAGSHDITILLSKNIWMKAMRWFSLRCQSLGLIHVVVKRSLSSCTKQQGFDGDDRLGHDAPARLQLADQRSGASDNFHRIGTLWGTRECDPHVVRGPMCTV